MRNWAGVRYCCWCSLMWRRCGTSSTPFTFFSSMFSLSFAQESPRASLLFFFFFPFFFLYDETNELSERTLLFVLHGRYSGVFRVEKLGIGKREHIRWEKKKGKEEGIERDGTANSSVPGVSCFYSRFHVFCFDSLRSRQDYTSLPTYSG